MQFAVLKNTEPSPFEERTLAPIGSIEFLWAQKKHLQGPGDSTSLKSIVSLLYLYCGAENSILFVGTEVCFYRQPK